MSSSNPRLQAAVKYLLNKYNEQFEAWVPVPKEVDDAPHAPWWGYTPIERRDDHHLPRVEISGYFHDYSELVPADLLVKLTSPVLTHLETVLDEKMDMHELLSYIRLAETEKLPETEKNKVLKKSLQAAPYVVTREPDKWTSYCAKPLWLAPFPTSPLAEVLKKEVEVNLDYEIEHQNPDGSWSPHWSWGGEYPEAWEEAKRDWQGVLTLNTLKSLRAFGRIEGF